MVKRQFSGAMHVFGDNVDTDQIYPGQYLDVTDHREMALHCLQGASDTFSQEFKEGDIVVAGRNFGCGSSRENAAIALSARGVSCVVAKSYARIFYRNAVNIGLPLLVCPDLDKIAFHGDVLDIDMEAGTARNRSSGVTAALEPVSDYALKILDAGGIKPLMRAMDAQA
ncbi:MAG TPA: 3-isopropylmalate dehydratase small subunit [Candidatus Limnocylindria bacterium]|nr:3-isopropylmalate dehydratase small subunit [Candidatus Limnocylindria bacterium]